ncbi:Eukaryotic translation initiation factor 5B [Frankliniella fusca]|uniref:Eukaryotic translation initiation factor 5B n=1 Tax=Frankliniella fusca TaxID=407009 RepID=A0AAE1LLQ2_9NEOP|nr:Eukaryotic translation initiation factor 5B [Frankliniella fusca]
MGKAKKGKTPGKEEEISDDEVDIQASEDKPSQSSKKSKADKNVEVSEDEEQPKSKGKDKKKKSKKTADSDDEIESDDEDSKPAKKRDKKKKGKAANSDSEEESIKSKTKSKADSDEESDVPKKTKSKKGKKAKNDSGDDDDGDDDRVSTKSGKKSKKKKKGGASSDEEVGAVKSSFALLSVEDDDSGAESPPPQPETESEAEEVNTKGKGKKNSKPAPPAQSGKKKKKKKDDDDEDLDAMLAELALEYAGVKKEDAGGVEEETGKKKKKKAKGAEDEQNGKCPSYVPQTNSCLLLGPESFIALYFTDEEAGKKSIKKGQEAEEDTIEDGDNEEGGTVKTAAQKKKEKKERQKQERKEGKVTEDAKPKTEKKVEKKAPPPAEEKDEAEDGDDKKKKKKGKEKDDDKGDKGKKGPAKKTIAAMQEALKKIREEEERLAKEEEERIKRIEAAEEAKREAARLEQERKDKKKQKEKERKERLKAEGKLLTPKQKAERARAQALLEARKAQGLDLPNVGEKKPVRPGTRVRPSKLKSQTSQEKDESVPKTDDQSETIQVEIVDKEEEKPKEPEDDVKDSWDAESSEEEEKPEAKTPTPAPVKGEKKATEESSEDDSSDEESESDSEEESSDSEESDSDGEGRTDAERKREKALARIQLLIVSSLSPVISYCHQCTELQKRREEAEKNRTVKNLRAAVVCVLGHVDTGKYCKTKILDKLRRTNVQDGEAGGITQQIGATNVPIDAIKEQVKIVKDFDENDLRIPGLLIIDTPGHESFSNLRNRGSSLCDIAILVVDIMHALEPQTIESINLLKAKKTPFVVALNKIDRLYDWQTMNRKDVRDIIKGQQANTQLEFEQRTKEVILQFAEQGLNAALFYENPDPRSYVSLVPTSAITGEGMGNILALIVDNCQNLLAKRLMYSDDLQATVLEVKAIPGLGTTIDCILVNGKLREGDTMIVAGTDGPIVTQIRSLLMPQPMKELRVKNAYVEYKEIKAAQGVKIAAKELEKAIAGLNLQVAQHPDEVEILKEEVAKDLKSALSHVKLAERGVYVQASTLGSLEALLEFLKSSKIPYANIRIGPVVRKDVMKASIMLEHDSQFATILAFDVKVERDAQELADSTGVKIFQADIIYHLFDKFMAYREELKQRKRDEFKHIAVFPCKLRVLPQFVFNSRDPIVCGVMVEAGIVREGTPICVPSKDFVDIGIITSVESNHKAVENARKGMEVCIKIEPVPGEAPKMFGRHFDETDMLVSKISRQSIDACKDYFRDDLNKQDWQLMEKELKDAGILICPDYIRSFVSYACIRIARCSVDQ